MNPSQVVEGAIAKILLLVPHAQRGKTATPAHQMYNGVSRAALATGSLEECTCGQRKLGWSLPEFIATHKGKTWVVGYNSDYNLITCGPNGYHSDRHGNEPPCR